MFKLDDPSKKLFIRDLKLSQKVETEDPKLWSWKVDIYGRTIDFTAVWIQGTVVKNNDNSSELVIDDGTGVARVVGCDKVPSICPRVKKGQYVKVICALIAQKPVPIVKASKVQDLTSSNNNESSWILEVIDQLTY